MVLGYSMSCLTRVYELSPSEIAARKERQLRQDAQRGWLGHLIEQQEERLKELRKPLDDLKGAISAEKHKDFLAVYKELAERPENQGSSVRRLADLAEHEQEAIAPSQRESAKARGV